MRTLCIFQFSRRLTGRDGIWLISRIREQRPELPVILTTDGILPESAFRDAEQLGKVTFLAKPFTRRELDEALRTAMGRDLGRTYQSNTMSDGLKP